MEGGLPLFGPHRHLLLYEESQVNTSPRYDRPKAGCLRVAKDRLILGRYNGATEEAKPEPSSNIQVLLLDGDPYLDPPRVVSKIKDTLVLRIAIGPDFGWSNSRIGKFSIG
ncbi:hypothetical protein H5410_061889 [Solanum commersonii]|uniref:Uncharacterized protein n=1 Tax=Solanum commersonii TaxID=4109 RepID=A0A9J5W8X9_SOLCO|nr:hypothetical protein H5410_061889 [Solanum commersonii]